MRQFVCYRPTVSHSLPSSNPYMSRILFPILRVLDFIADVLAVLILSRYQRQYAKKTWLSYLCFAVIPYNQGVTGPIKRIINSHNVKVGQKPFQTLWHIFAKPKDPVTNEQLTDAFYSIP